MNSTLIIEGIMMILSFCIGAKIGQMTYKGEEIKTPSVVQVIKEHKENRAIALEKEQFDTMMENIDKYDGTGIGQKDVRW